jgi:hypothetical protein
VTDRVAARIAGTPDPFRYFRAETLWRDYKPVQKVTRSGARPFNLVNVASVRPGIRTKRVSEWISGHDPTR